MKVADGTQQREEVEGIRGHGEGVYQVISAVEVAYRIGVDGDTFAEYFGFYGIVVPIDDGVALEAVERGGFCQREGGIGQSALRVETVVEGSDIDFILLKTDVEGSDGVLDSFGEEAMGIGREREDVEDTKQTQQSDEDYEKGVEDTVFARTIFHCADL